MASRDYPADGLTIHWDSSLCYHAAECVRSQPRVFDPKRRPWIVTEGMPVDAIAAAIDRCPSGALSYTRHDGTTTIPAGATIAASPGGPLIVSGELAVVDDHGAVVRRSGRLALCRCGASDNKPYCDGSHTAAGFDDPGIVDSHPGAGEA